MKVSLKFSFLLALVVLTGCSPTNSLQPDDVLLDQSQNAFGEQPLNFDDVIKAPQEKPFRIQELEHIESLVKSLQTSRMKSREAVFVGQEETFFLKSPYSKDLFQKKALLPKDRVQIFWPTDIVNDHIKIKIDQDKVAWLKYRNAKSEPQVILVEDFIIPQVSIEDSRLIVIKETDNNKPVVIITSNEEVKKIVYEVLDEQETDTVGVTEETDLDQTVGQEEADNIAEEDQNSSAVDPDISIEPFVAPDSLSSNTTSEDDVINIAPVQSEDLSQSKDKNSDTTPDLSEIDPKDLPRPTPRPDYSPPSNPPLLGAGAMNPEQLLSTLGIKSVSIPRESAYIATGKKRISEVFPGAHKTFSACTFNPAQGSENSRCYRELILSEDFTDFLESQGSVCAKEAAKSVFGSQPLKVLLRTNGGSVNRSNARSLHYRGRALDVFAVFLYFQKEKGSRKITFHKNSMDGSSAVERRNYNFYWKFESCWKKKVSSYHKTKSCQSKGSGVLTYRYNTDHNDHMHISLPVCRSLKKKFNLNST